MRKYILIDIEIIGILVFAGDEDGKIYSFFSLKFI